MRSVNGFLEQTPFDLYELALFRLVVKHKSFTAAAQVAGLTQSAVTRQIQGMENALGVQLLKRTTRSLSLTSAGEFLSREASRLIGDVESSLRFIRQEYAGAPKQIRVAVSHTIGLAYLPGFFHVNVRQLTGVTYQVRFSRSAGILLELEADEHDLGVICPPPRLPRTVEVAHRFKDVFTLIGPEKLAGEYAALADRERKGWLCRQVWLLIDAETITGARVQSWLKRTGLRVQGEFAMDSFDLIINLVALGMGVSLVPARALALYGQKRKIRRMPFAPTFSRELVVVKRKQQKTPPHVEQFIANILF
jgi:DNA-binding transcriptional LysR family regulator